MKKLMDIDELVKEGYQRAWLYQIAHSENFILAGGRRLPKKKSKIYFDPEKLDHYFEQITLLNQ